MLLAASILRAVGGEEIKGCLNIPASYFLGSDLMYTFMTMNSLIQWNDQKYKSEAEIRADYPKIQQEYLAGEFPPDIVGRLAEVMKMLGNKPLIVRSSSQLEYNFGTSFAGKYDSFFAPTRGHPMRIYKRCYVLSNVYMPVRLIQAHCYIGRARDFRTMTNEWQF